MTQTALDSRKDARAPDSTYHETVVQQSGEPVIIQDPRGEGCRKASRKPGKIAKSATECQLLQKQGVLHNKRRLGNGELHRRSEHFRVQRL